MWIHGWFRKIQWNTITTKKKSFQSHLNMEDITDVDYTHAKRVRKDFKITKVDENHALCVQSNTLLLADVF